MGLSDKLRRFGDAIKRPAKATARRHILIQPRTALRADAERPSLLNLGTDILSIIVDFVQDTHPASVLSIALVSSYLHSIARYSQHRSITVKVPREDDAALCDRLDYTEKQGLLPAIRQVQIIDSDYFKDGALLRICELLPKMTGLRDVSWPRTFVPVRMIEALAALPDVRLHVVVPERYLADNLYTLPHCTNLSSLKFSAIYHDTESCLATTQPLKQILLSCANLRSLTLDISLPRSGCVSYGRPGEYCGFGFTDGGRPLAALDELVLVNYPWGNEMTPGSAIIPGLTQTGYPNPGTEIDYWAGVFDWSRLRRLRVSSSYDALKLMPKLTALREVAFASTWDREGSTRFYQEVPAVLESIKVPAVASITLDGIVRHSDALRRLEVHQNEDSQGAWRAEAITVEQLRNIKDECPHVEELAIDLARQEGDWPWQALNVLAVFPRLRKLELWFELGLDNREAPLKPHVTFSATAMLFGYLRKQSPKQPAPLQRLEVHSGTPPPFGCGFPAPTAFWPDSQTMAFACTLSERDDEASDGKFTVSCPCLSARDDKIEDEMKTAKRKVKGGTVWETGKLHLALEGPTPVHQWHGESFPFDRRPARSLFLRYLLKH